MPIFIEINYDLCEVCHSVLKYCDELSMCDNEHNSRCMSHLYKVCHKNKQSTSGLNIAWIAGEYEIKTSDIQQCNILTLMNKVYFARSKDLGDEQWKIDL